MPTRTSLAVLLPPNHWWAPSLGKGQERDLYSLLASLWSFALRGEEHVWNFGCAADWAAVRWPYNCACVLCLSG